jgi:hypothetical protein
MSKVLQVLFFLWIGWVVLVVVFQFFAAIFQILAEKLPPLFNRLTPPPRSPASKVPHPVAKDPGHPAPKPTLPSRLDVMPLPNECPGYPLGFSVESGVSQDAQTFLTFKVSGGPRGAKPNSVAYVVTASCILDGKPHVLADQGFIVSKPAPFRKVFVLDDALPCDGRAVVLGIAQTAQMMPPRGGSIAYDFVCEAHDVVGVDFLSKNRVLGGLLAKTECAAVLHIVGPGYLDESEWMSLRLEVVRVMTYALRKCIVNVDEKEQKFNTWLRGLSPIAATYSRQNSFKSALLQAHEDADASAGVDMGVFCDVRDSKDHDLMESIARLLRELAGREADDSECRKLFFSARDLFNVYLDGEHISKISPAPPLWMDPTPAPMVNKSPFELSFKPLLEGDVAKGLEVFVRGTAGARSVVERRLTFWVFDDFVATEPALIACPDIDLVHQRVTFQMSWRADGYQPDQWQLAGVVRFNDCLLPFGGQRYLAVAGRLAEYGAGSAPLAELSAQSKPALLKVASSGYLKIRQARLELRREALVLAFGLALISGKSPTYMQEKALKAFADQLCSGLADKAYADSCREAFRALLESTTVSDFDHLTRMLQAFARKAPPELKTQLHDAFGRIIAARKVRSKESRELLRYSAEVLAA